LGNACHQATTIGDDLTGTHEEEQRGATKKTLKPNSLEKCMSAGEVERARADHKKKQPIASKTQGAFSQKLLLCREGIKNEKNGGRRKREI